MMRGGGDTRSVRTDQHLTALVVYLVRWNLGIIFEGDDQKPVGKDFGNGHGSTYTLEF